MKVIDIVKDIIIKEDLCILKSTYKEPSNGWDKFEKNIRDESENLNTIEDFIEYSPIFQDYKYKDAVVRVSMVIDTINISGFIIDN